MNKGKVLQLVLIYLLLSSCQSTVATSETYSEGLNLMISTKLIFSDDLEHIKSQQIVYSEKNAIDINAFNTLAGTGVVQSAFMFAKTGAYINPKNFMSSTMLLSSFLDGMSGKGMRRHRWTYNYVFHIDTSCQRSSCVNKNLGAYWDTLSALYDKHPSKTSDFEIKNYYWSEPTFLLNYFNGSANIIKKLSDGSNYETDKIMLKIPFLDKKSEHNGIDVWGNDKPYERQDLVKLAGLNYPETTQILIEASKKHPEIFIFRRIGRMFGECIGAFFINNGEVIVPIELGCLPKL